MNTSHLYTAVYPLMHTHSSSSRLDFLLCVCFCISLYNRSTFRTLISTSCSRFRKSVSRTAEVSPSYFLTLNWLSIACLHATLLRSDGNGGESLGCERRSWSVIESVWASSLSVCLSVPPKPVHLRARVPPAPCRPLPPLRPGVPSAGPSVGRLIQSFHSSRYVILISSVFNYYVLMFKLINLLYTYMCLHCTCILKTPAFL